MNNLKQFWNKFLNTLTERGAVVALLIGLAPAALVFYVGYTTFIEPGRTANGEERKVVEKLESDVNRGRAVEMSEPEFKKEFARVVELFYDTLPLLPKETEISSVLASVQEVARRDNVTLTGLLASKEAQKTANADKLFEREMPSQVVGNYDDVMRFFLDLSRMQRIMIVRDYTVSAPKRNQSVRPSYVSVQFNLLAYHAPQAADYPNLPADIRVRPQTAAMTQSAQNAVNGDR